MATRDTTEKTNRYRTTPAILGDELGTLQKAVEGVLTLTEWAYEQTDEDARKALPQMQGMLELISHRLGKLHRGMAGE